ncbi:hypothetical protein LTR93_011964 [Exophiala xenobiotica]|nr:hypothetical protein LTR93_011964 [Exophiala xenobiotica]
MALFEDKVFAISGGASGMGLAVAKLLASRGARITIADWQEQALSDAAAAIEQSSSSSLKPAVLTHKVDVRSTEQVDAWIKEAIQTFGRLDGAANMAGIAGRMGAAGVKDQDDDDWELTIGINLTGLMHCLRAQLRVLTHGGSIVNAASTAGLHGAQHAAPYAASKHGVIGLSRSAAKEVGIQGIRVNCIAPGPISTPLFHGTKDIDHDYIREMTALKRVGEPEEAAALVAFLLGDDSKYITGAVYVIDGGIVC